MKRGKIRWSALLLALVMAVSLSMAGCKRKEKAENSSSSQSESSDRDEPDEPDEEEEPDPDNSDGDSSDGDDPAEDQDGDEDGKDGKDTGSSKPPVGPQGGTAAKPSQSSSAAPQPSSKPQPTAPSSRPQQSSPSKPQSSKPSSSSRPQSSSSSKSTASTTVSSKLTDITYKDTGAYSKQATYRGGTIRSDNVILRNKTFKGDVTITSAAGSEDISLENCTVEGTLTVNGGTGWLKLYDSDIASLVLDKKGAKVYASKKTNVEDVAVKKNATLQEGTIPSGYHGFRDVTVSGSRNARTDLNLQKTSLDELTVDTQSWVTLDSDSSIDEAYADAPAYFKGAGDIGELTASNSYVYYQYKPDYVYTEGKAQRPRKYESGNNYWDGESSSSDDDDDDDYDSKRDDVYITWVDSVSNVRLTKGAEKAVRIDTNARDVTVSSSNTSVCAVSINAAEDEIALTPRKAGSAEITVKGTRSGYNSEKRSFDIRVSEAGSPPITNLSYYFGSRKITSNTWVNGDVKIQWNVGTDNLYRVTVNGSRVSGTSAGLYTYTATKTDTYRIVAEASNSARDSVETASVRIDKEVPQIVLNANAARALNTPIQFTATDSGGSGIDTVKVNGNTAAFVSGSIYSFTPTVAGLYTIRVTDKAGNVRDSSINVGSTAPVPTVTVSAQDAQAANKGSAEVPFTVSFTNTAADQIEVKVTDNSAVSQPVAVSRKSASSGSAAYTFTAANNATYTIVARVKNVANLENSKTVTVSGLDKTPPVITVEKTPNRESNLLVFTVTDENGSGVAQARVLVGDVDATITPQNGKYNYTDTLKNEHELTIKATDVAGNEATEKLNLNTTAVKPVIEVTAEAASGWAKSKTITVRASNGAAVTAEGPGTIANGVFTATANGTVTFKTAGADDVTRVIEGIDNEAPVVTVPSAPAAGWHNTAQTVQFTVSDAGSGVVGVTVTDNGTPKNTSGSYTYTVEGDGTHTIRINAADALGNAAAEQVLTVQIDTSTPAAPKLQQKQEGNLNPVDVTVAPSYSASAPAFATFAAVETKNKIFTIANSNTAVADRAPMTVLYQVRDLASPEPARVSWQKGTTIQNLPSGAAIFETDHTYSVEILVQNDAGTQSTISNYKIKIVNPTVSSAADPTSPTTSSDAAGGDEGTIDPESSGASGE